MVVNVERYNREFNGNRSKFKNISKKVNFDGIFRSETTLESKVVKVSILPFKEAPSNLCHR